MSQDGGLATTVDRLMTANRKMIDGRFSSVSDSWTAALNMSETIAVEMSNVESTMNTVMIFCIIGIIVLGIIVWNSTGHFKIRLTVTLISSLLVVSLLYNLNCTLRDSMLRISRESTGIVYGFAHAMSLANIINASDVRFANQGLLTAESSAAAAAAARSQNMMM